MLSLCQVIMACTQGQENCLGAIRPQFIQLVVQNGADCSPWRVNALSLLTRGGRHMDQGAPDITAYLTALVERAVVHNSVSGERNVSLGEDQQDDYSGPAAARALLGSVVCLEGIIRYSFTSVIPCTPLTQLNSGTGPPGAALPDDWLRLSAMSARWISFQYWRHTKHIQRADSGPHSRRWVSRLPRRSAQVCFPASQQVDIETVCGV